MPLLLLLPGAVTLNPGSSPDPGTPSPPSASSPETSSAGAGDSLLLYPGFPWAGPGETAAKVMAYLVIFTLSLGGNLLILFILSRGPANFGMRPYIANLAASDLLSAVFGMWFACVNHLLPTWVFGDFLCHLTTLVQGVTFMSSVFTLVAVALDRLRAVTRPLSPRPPRRLVAGALASMWLLAVALNLPAALFTNQDQFEWDDFLEVWCGEQWPQPDTKLQYDAALLVLTYAAPLLAMSLAWCA
ncbi:neuropeptide FF receptor 2-like [Lampetra fluviatilis]